MRRVVLVYGLIAGLIMSAMLVFNMAFFDHIGFDKGVIIGYTSMVVAFLMVFFGVRTYRDTVAGGTIGFGRAFGVGMLIVLLASTVYVLSWEIIGPRMAPDFMERYTEHVIEKKRAEGASEAELAAERQEQEKFREMYRNPVIRFAFGFLEPLPVGLVLSLVTAGILRTRGGRGNSKEPVEATA